MSFVTLPALVGRLSLRNRIVRSATWEGMAGPDGAPTEAMAEYAIGLVDGGVGLLISGYNFVRLEGKQNPGQAGLHDDAMIPAHRAYTTRIHERGGAIIAQLVHCGGQARRKSSGLAPVAPSAIELPHYPEMPTELGLEDVRALVSAFGSAARRAQAAGYDGVQIHGAHGYLVSQFLAPFSNRRTDAYGGELENRLLFVVEILAEIRKQTSDDYPVWIKLNGDDFVEGGMTALEAVEVADRLAREGIDAIEVSGGTPASGDRTPARRPNKEGEFVEAYHRELAAAIKRRIPVPVGIVGGIRSIETIDDMFAKGEADFFSIARPLIREPGLVARWIAGDTAPAKCVSCNGCFIPAMKEGAVRCVKEGR